MLSDTILRLSAVKTATGLSRSTIYERMRLGTFPTSVPLGGNSVGWMESEIDAWIQRRRAERTGKLEHGDTESVENIR